MEDTLNRLLDELGAAVKHEASIQGWLDQHEGETVSYREIEARLFAARDDVRAARRAIVHFATREAEAGGKAES
jgi:hypothetical protein